MPKKLLPTGAQHPGITPSKDAPFKSTREPSFGATPAPSNRPMTAETVPIQTPHPGASSHICRSQRRPPTQTSRLQAVDGTCSRLIALVPAHMLHLAHLASPCPFRWSFHSRNASTPAYNQIFLTAFTKPHCDLLLVCLRPGVATQHGGFRLFPSATINVTALQGRHGYSGRIITCCHRRPLRSTTTTTARCSEPTPKPTVLKWRWDPGEMSMQAGRPLSCSPALEPKSPGQKRCINSSAHLPGAAPFPFWEHATQHEPCHFLVLDE